MITAAFLKAAGGLAQLKAGLLREAFIMWVVISITKDKAAAEKVKEFLDKEGILVDLRPITKKKEAGTYEILVLESEALEARDILSDCGII